MAEYFSNLNAQQSKFELHGNRILNLLRDALNKPEARRETTIRTYQIECVLRTKEKFQSLEQVRRPKPAIIVAPTGSGKSGIITLLPYVLQSKKVLILTPAISITNQLAESFGLTRIDKCFFHKTINYFKTNQRTLRDLIENGRVIRSTEDVQAMELANLVIVNAQKFGGQSNSSLFSNNRKVVEDVQAAFGHFEVIIVDEAHHYPAPTWEAIVNNFRNKQILFLTATPIKANGERIFSQAQITYEVQKGDIEGRYVRHLEFRCLSLGRFVNGNNWEPQYLTQIHEDITSYLDNHDRRYPIPNNKKHKAIVLVRLQDEAKDLANYWPNATYCIAGAQGDENQRQFDTGKRRIMIICGKLREGYDNPTISVCVILRRVRSHLLFAQFIGRCSRLSHVGDQAHGIVLTYKAFQQQEMWDNYDKIALSDPEEDD